MHFVRDLICEEIIFNIFPLCGALRIRAPPLYISHSYRKKLQRFLLKIINIFYDAKEWRIQGFNRTDDASSLTGFYFSFVAVNPDVVRNSTYAQYTHRGFWRNAHNFRTCYSKQVFHFAGKTLKAFFFSQRRRFFFLKLFG